jgi:hypothetical protein
VSTPSTGSVDATAAAVATALRWAFSAAIASGDAPPVSSPAQAGEEQRDLACGRLGRVRAVDHVLADRDRVVAADRAGVGLKRVGRADHLARGAIACSPSSTIATSGPEVMNVTSSS